MNHLFLQKENRFHLCDERTLVIAFVALSRTRVYAYVYNNVDPKQCERRNNDSFAFSLMPSRILLAYLHMACVTEISFGELNRIHITAF